MQGIIIHRVKNFARAMGGKQAWDELLSRTGQAGREFTFQGQYPDEEFESLMNTLAEMLEKPPEKLLELFGQYLMPHLLEVGAVMGLLQDDWTTADLVENIPAIHQALRQYNPGVEPPEIRTVRSLPNQVALTYRSHRHLCPMVRGLLLGAARYYLEEIAVTEQVCTRKGGPICRFVVTVKGKEEGGFVLPTREFEAIIKSGGHITFYNLYKGVPISYEGTFRAVRDKSILVQAPPNQLAAIQKEGKTYFSSSAIQAGIEARVKQLDWPAGLVELHLFHYGEEARGMRRSVRVLPEQPIPVKMTLGRETHLAGEIRNISVGGLSVSIPEQPLPNKELYENVELLFKLPYKRMDKAFQGMIDVQLEQKLAGNILGAGQVDGMIVFRIVFAERSTEGRLAVEEYVMQRQLELLRELRDLVRG